MNHPLLFRTAIASLLAAGAFALGQGADADLQVPGAKYVAVASRGFDALASGGACPTASTEESSWPSTPAVPSDSKA